MFACVRLLISWIRLQNFASTHVRTVLLETVLAAPDLVLLVQQIVNNAYIQGRQMTAQIVILDIN